MAFATSAVRSGISGDKRVLTGSWTGSSGDANGTYTVKGKVFQADFDDQLTTGPGAKPLVTWSESGGTTTITIPNFRDVTAGTYRIEFIG